MATNGNFNHQSQYKGSTDQPTASSTTPESSATHIYNQHDPGSVGWFFVEQYYTTLSSFPERLHLFYSKRSQFVYGVEAEVANVSVGRSAIQERIKALEFSDCKVRVSNVDTQQSFDNILIQVIGEISNKTAEPKKFVQTFVLAQQPNGYFVLNDIFRYIIDEGDGEPVEAAPPQEVVPEAEPEVLGDVAAPVDQAAPEPEASALESAPAHLDAAVIDKKLEEVSSVAKDSSPPSATGTPAEPATEAQDAGAVAPDAAAEGLPDPDKAAHELAEEDAKKEEAPKDPTPTPVVARVSTPVAAEPEKPKEPPKPMSWANRVAAAAGAAAAPRPVVPLPKTSTPPAPAQSRPPPAAAPPAPGATSQPLESSVAASKPARDPTSEWQTASANPRRQNHPGSISSPPTERDMTMGYIRNVTEKIQTEDLRAALSKYGELVYFDVNRSKNCAFVEFTTHAGYLAATGANPHMVNGEEINVEPRRPKANAYGGSNYDRGRGGLSGGRGRGGYDGPRSGSGSQGGGRGAFGGLGRGGRGGGGPPSRGGRGGISQPGNV